MSDADSRETQLQPDLLRAQQEIRDQKQKIEVERVGRRHTQRQPADMYRSDFRQDHDLQKWERLNAHNVHTAPGRAQGPTIVDYYAQDCRSAKAQAKALGNAKSVQSIASGRPFQTGAVTQSDSRTANQLPLH